MAITDEMLDEMIGTAKTQDDFFGKDGLLNTLSKRLLERMLDGEMVIPPFLTEAKSRGLGN